MAIADPKILLTELQKVLGEGAKGLTEETVRNCLKVGELLSQGKTRIKDILQISDQHMEMLYMVACNFYQRNKIEKANKIFTTLCTYDPLGVKYWEGLGLTCKMLKQYNEAIAAYYMLTQLHALKISYYLDLADCFIRINQIEGAKQCCEAIIRMAKNETFKAENPDAEECSKKAETLKKILNKLNK